MATLLLTAVGTVVGGPIGGAIGALAGRALDQAVLLKPRGRQGPRLSDLHVQTSTYGSAIPQVFGRIRVAGTVIWATDLRETSHKSGGGKGRPSVTSFTYSASFAVALSSRVAGGVGRIWADGNLLRGSAGDFKTEIGGFRFHDGSEDQAVDPLIAAAQGVAATPAHRGIAYAVFEDLALADYGNRIPSLTFEMLADADTADVVDALTEGAVSGTAVDVEGYAAEGDAGASLMPLAEAHGWVLWEDSGGLALDAGVEAGAVAQAMLAARINGRTATPLRRARATAEDVPVRLSLRHYEQARDYQAGVQKASRPGPGRRERTIELPAVVTAADARMLAQARLGSDWAARTTLELHCGWEALVLVPGMAVTVEGVGGRWRIVEMEWEGMGVRLSLVALPGGAAVALPASSGAAVLQPDAPHGATRLMLADLPGLGDDAPVAPVVVAAAAGESAGWRRAALFVREPGSGEALPIGQTAARATMGSVLTPLASGSAMLFDAVGSTDVELLSDAMLLTGTDEATLLRGGNLCLVGRELLQFCNANQIGPRRFRLSRLLRGRRGSEWAMGLHEAGEPFLLIEADRVATMPSTAVHVGEAMTALAIGIGDVAPAEAGLTVSGEALTPPAPVHLRQAGDGTGALTLNWMRRSRAGWRWLDGVDAPLCEEQERYVVRILSGSSIVREAETLTPQWSYGAAMRAADAAAHPGPWSAHIRQIGTFATGRAAHLILA